MSARLSGLKIGALTLTPAFDPDVASYTATTTNTITATAEAAGAEISILNGSTAVENGAAATWADGENTLTITVTNGESEKTYAVTVTKETI